MTLLRAALHSVAAGSAAQESRSFCPGLFEPGTDCRWRPADVAGPRMNAHTIARPAAGRDRDAWLAALRTYRRYGRERDPTNLHWCAGFGL